MAITDLIVHWLGSEDDMLEYTYCAEHLQWKIKDLLNKRSKTQGIRTITKDWIAANALS